MLIFGGSATEALPEFWSPYDATNIEDVPGTPKIIDRFTLDAVESTIISCRDSSCTKFSGGSWVPHSDTFDQRLDHTSAIHGGRILLVGGSGSPTTTEWHSVDGLAEEGMFALEDPGRENHCSITLEDPPSMILTGGKNTGTLVTQYSLPNGEILTPPIPAMTESREHHACGVYQNSEGSQVR